MLRAQVAGLDNIINLICLPGLAAPSKVAVTQEGAIKVVRKSKCCAQQNLTVEG